jgi:nitroimidazol reductase NimA-like FMN-containing flavoprotein (pyridoxamine 5'-phosphate oxidase superfamily)
VRTDRLGITMLESNECWELLRSSDVGRLALWIDNQLEIFPVNFVVDHGSVVFRTAEGTKLAAAASAKAVAFEIDGYDADVVDAWSVVVKGRANVIEAQYELFAAVALPLFPWHAAPKQHFVRIEPDVVSGRRFHVVDRSAWGVVADDVRAREE